MKMISELKTKVAALTAELAEYKSVLGQLRTADLEKENGNLRSKHRSYKTVISRNDLWSYFSRHRKMSLIEESRDNGQTGGRVFARSPVYLIERRNILSIANGPKDELV